jgi:choice-of-anchor B domain-containing protein
LLGIDPRYRLAMAKQGFTWAASRENAESGIFDNSTPPALQSKGAAPATCQAGFAGQFPCRNVDFLAQLTLADFSTRPSSAANVWGLVDLNDNREYAVIGLRNGTAIVDVTDPANPREVTTIPGNSSAWREVKLYQVRDTVANRYRAYAYVTTEAPGSGLQVIDLSGLPASASLATTLTDTGSQHTAYVSNINYATNVALPGAQAFLYLAGSNVAGGAWRAYSLANPAQPQPVGTATPGSGYMHDSTSLLLTDARTSQCEPGHNPCEVLVDFNETTIDLWDVTNKSLPVRLSTTTYPNVEYTHSGWPSGDQRFIMVHDELEEIRRGLNTQIYTLNIDNLRFPTIVTSFRGLDTTTDHNGYTKGNRYYVSHYRRGLVVFDATNPAQLAEIGNFDTFLVPAANSAGTDGAWGVYPLLPSGTILISDISNGLFLLREQAANPAGRLAFVGSSATVVEGSGSVTVRVERAAGSTGAVSVSYSTANGTALAGTDYTAASGTLQWANGETGERTVVIQVANNTSVTGNRNFQLVLSNASGGVIVDGTTSYAITIQEDDVAAPPPVPSGGGGGGMFEPWLLLLLVLLAAGRSSTRRPARRRSAA